MTATGDKFVNDPIHGYVRLDTDQLMLIDTPQFQRLRDLKQLGSAYFVFPGACHHRFEHSIGVSHLADSLYARLVSNTRALIDSSSDRHAVKIAGLVHDLGHGPFSHVFDNEFIPRARPGYNWKHEQGSEMLLDFLLEDNNIDMDPHDVRLIKDLVDGTPSKPYENRFIFDIVANKRNSVDVDKFDYLQRDCFNVGVKSNYDCSRLMTFCKVIDDQICYSHKEVYNIYEMFQTRYSLFRRVYTHKVGKAIEHMIVDAMLLADPFLHLSSQIDDPEQYSQLTDSILIDIEKSRTQDLMPARNLIRRIRKRQLYKFVEEYTVSRPMQTYLTKETVNPAIIMRYHDSQNGQLNENDIIVDFLCTNYGMKSKNPVDNVNFYGKWREDVAFHIPKEKVSFMITDQYEDTTIRVFSRDPEKVPLIQRAFRKCMMALTHDAPTVPSTSSLDEDVSRLALAETYEKGEFETFGQRASQESDQQCHKEKFQPHPIDDLPDMKTWQELSQERGWSPHKTTKPRVSSRAETRTDGFWQRAMQSLDDGDEP